MGNRGASVCSFRALVLADRPGSIHTLRAAPVTSRAPGSIVKEGDTTVVAAFVQAVSLALTNQMQRR